VFFLVWSNCGEGFAFPADKVSMVRGGFVATAWMRSIVD
jgi:hypothetical protein